MTRKYTRAQRLSHAAIRAIKAGKLCPCGNPAVDEWRKGFVCRECMCHDEPIEIRARVASPLAQFEHW